ncbi:hypothetical protein [Streptomyces europaeiscabiei]|uniref:hypothetical protein n=1 Tax=Streptomyces europaeiscabiei TaxID=146819 RepID=UPI0029A63359|nr:hypothetical protein [Streptomyces europaeiscabiei]MDX3589094.1 hypothetical protein [Streptomyces europaeiscabiei]
MQHDAAAWLIEIALALRVFGPDVVRRCRRLLTAGVRIGITQLTSGRTPARTPEPQREAS